MFRFLIRSGVVALFLLSLSAPAQALPLREAGSFGASLSELWERLTAPVASFWIEATRGSCDPNGGDCTNGGTAGGETAETRGSCDPNGGACEAS